MTGEPDWVSLHRSVGPASVKQMPDNVRGFAWDELR